MPEEGGKGGGGGEGRRKMTLFGNDRRRYAARTVFKALQSPTSHETCVKVGGYILGEFGHLISEQPESLPKTQLDTLHNKFPTCSLETRAMLLSTYHQFDCEDTNTPK